MDDDDTMMGGYGLEEEQERQRHQARLAGFGDDESGGEEPEESDRQKIFMPVATNIVAALGGGPIFCEKEATPPLTRSVLVRSRLGGTRQPPLQLPCTSNSTTSPPPLTGRRG